MNNKFGDLFTIPEDWNKQIAFAKRDTGVRIRSLVNPEKKMSKSISDPRGTILLTDDPADAAKKVMGATTDSFEEVKFDMKERPGISNLLQMLALLTERPLQEVTSEWEGKTRYGELKTAVAEMVKNFLTDFQAKYNAINETELQNKLKQDEATMREVSHKTLSRVQQAVGLRPKA
jgi:tryptophanyl-tRNA synthetase